MRRCVTMMVLVVFSVFGAGCATILGGGGSEEVEITSEPSGADVMIDGQRRGKTPMTANLSTKKSHAIKIKKGCMTHDGPVYTGRKREMGWIIADYIFLVPTLYLSLGIDYATGAYYTFDKKRVSVKLEGDCDNSEKDSPGNDGNDDEKNCSDREYCDGKDNDCDGVIDEGCG